MQNDKPTLIDSKKQLPQIDGKDYMIIQLDDKKYAFEAIKMIEVTKLIELDFLNKMPSSVIGFFQYQQGATPVIDLREIFKNERKQYSISSKLLIVKTKEGIIAFACDTILNIEKIPNNLIEKIPFQNEDAFIEGIYSKDSENIYILNIENIHNHIINNTKDYIEEQAARELLPLDEDSIEILKDRKNLLIDVSQNNTNISPIYDKGVSFAINDAKYYINMANIKEFYKVNDSKFVKIPNTPSYIFGLINIKGDYITVLDISDFFNNTRTKIKEKSTIIILNSDELKIGILADKICESMNIELEKIIQNKIQKQDENSILEFVKNDEIYQVIDVAVLLNSEKLKIC